MRLSRKRPKRPPFENRWTSGERGWRWYLALEELGVDRVRSAVQLELRARDEDFVALAIPSGFIRDWLAFHDGSARQATQRFRLTVAALPLLRRLAR